MRRAKVRDGVKRIASHATRSRVTTVMECVGAGWVTYGVYQASEVAGGIVGGLLTIGLAFLIDLGGSE